MKKLLLKEYTNAINLHTLYYGYTPSISEVNHSAIIDSIGVKLNDQIKELSKSKESFSNSLDQLVHDMELNIYAAVNINGTESQYKNILSIKLPDDLCFNLNDKHYIEEVTGEYFLSNGGYQYALDCISTEQLAEITDHVCNI